MFVPGHRLCDRLPSFFHWPLKNKRPRIISANLALPHSTPANKASRRILYVCCFFFCYVSGFICVYSWCYLLLIFCLCYIFVLVVMVCCLVDICVVLFLLCFISFMCCVVLYIIYFLFCLCIFYVFIVVFYCFFFYIFVVFLLFLFDFLFFLYMFCNQLPRTLVAIAAALDSSRSWLDCCRLLRPVLTVPDYCASSAAWSCVLLGFSEHAGASTVRHF